MVSALLLAAMSLFARADQENGNRARATLERMSAVAPAIEAYLTATDKAPAASTSLDKRGSLADDDAVMRTAEFIRMWNEPTGSGDRAEIRRRKTLNPAARALLERADALQNGHDYAGALDAYMDAVKADPAAADLALINGYVPVSYTDEKSAAEREAEQQRISKAVPRQIAALRQYLQLRPGEWEATQALLFLVDLPEAESLLEPFFKSRPRDPELYDLRASLRAKQGLFLPSLDDYVKASELDPQNAQRYYLAGVVAYETVTKDKNLTDSAKPDLIKRGLAAFDRAEALKADYFESLTYHSLLLRQQALREKEPNVQKKLTDEADALRQRMIEILKRRRAAQEKP
jgi:5-formyltetrahydrofolate cyclo-ligase